VQNRYTNLCLDVDWNLFGRDIPVVQRACTGGLTQYWVFTYDASYQAYQVLSALNGLALSVENASSQSNARLVQSQWALLPSQRWQNVVVAP
jgi:hypothetical protein